jgi:hypothetical protein
LHNINESMTNRLTVLLMEIKFRPPPYAASTKRSASPTNTTLASRLSRTWALGESCSS